VRAEADLTAAFSEAMALAGLGSLVASGDRVLIKPNQHGGPGYTSAGVIRAAVQWAQACGAAEVGVGDGPFWGMTDAMPYFAETGLLAVCEETGARPLDFHQGSYRVVQTGSADLPPEVGFSEHVCEADVVLNVPVLKTHFNTLVTLGVKNLKGCLRPQDKRALHELELQTALAEVARLLKPRIAATIVDATTGWEGMGPVAATPVQMGLLVASADMIAADAVACDLIGLDPSQVRLLRACAERGVGEAALDRLDVVGEELAAHRRRFQLPYEALAAEFPGLALRSDHACSGCAMNLFRALEIARDHGQPIMCDTVVIGPAELSVGQVVSTCPTGQTLLVGRCTRAGWQSVPHVGGCPPRVDAIREALTGIAASEGVPRT